MLGLLQHACGIDPKANLAATLESARAQVYADIRKVRCLGSYYRFDLGETLWPPEIPST